MNDVDVTAQFEMFPVFIERLHLHRSLFMDHLKFTFSFNFRFIHTFINRPYSAEEAFDALPISCVTRFAGGCAGTHLVGRDSNSWSGHNDRQTNGPSEAGPRTEDTVG